MPQLQQQLLRYTSTDPTVDYDINVTPLYEYIGNSAWKVASDRCQQHPQEAGTWVVRYRRDSNGKKLTENGNNGVLWRFLPIHSACALGPPTYFIRALLQSYPAGTHTLDEQGMLPLHYACGSRISREALYLLLMSYPRAALKSDPNGMLPIHYLARWGPGEEGSIDMVCVATGKEHVMNWKDGDGNTPEMLARSAGYEGCEEVARRIREFGRGGDGSSGGGGGSINSNTKGLTVQTTVSGISPFPPSSAPQNADKYSTFEAESDELRTLIEDGKALIDKETTQFGNENAVWNRSTTTQNTSEQRAIMSKLGVSPVHRMAGAGSGGNNRYHSWDGTASVAGSSVGGSSYNSGGSLLLHLPRVDNVGTGAMTTTNASADRSRSVNRSVSWDRAADPPTSNDDISGSGARTTSDPPATVDRAFFGPSAPPVKKDTITSSSSHSSLRLSLPPISPRVSATTPTGTPKWGNQHHRHTTVNNREQQSELDDDRRLCELREEISTLRNSGSGSVGSTRREEAEVNSHTSGAIVPSPQHQQHLRVASTGSIDLKSDLDKSRVRQLMEDRQSAADKEREEKILMEKIAKQIKEMTAEEEKEAAIQTVRLEQQENEKKLLEEISKLKADKHRAEMALSKVAKLAPITSVRDSQSSEEGNDDSISKLTFAEVDESEQHHDCVEIVVSPKSKKGDPTYIISVENNTVEQLLEEKRKIERAIQRATSIGTASTGAGTSRTSKKSNRGRSKEKKVVVVDDDDLASISSNSTTMTPFKAAILAETAKRMAKLQERIDTERAKCSELEQQVQVLKEENDASTKLHSEAVFNHLQEVKLLREGFDEAKVEIDKYRNESGDMLKAKEEEWTIKERMLHEQIKDLHEQCRLARNAEERKSHELAREKEIHQTKEKEWEEKQLVLEEQIKNLREMRVSAQEPGKTEWTETQRILEDQIKDLAIRCSSVAQMKENEVQWVEERKRLVAEIEKLKEGKVNNLSSSSSISSSDDVRTRQFETAVKDAEYQRKFNAAMRKEHDETISELQSELTKERKGKTELLGKIVKMEFEIATLERELEGARAKARSSPSKNDEHGSGTTSKDRETMYLQQISDLRKKVHELQEQVDAHSQTTKELSKLRERALQEKDDECASLVRSLKKNHEMVLSEQEDAYQTKLRDAKTKLDEALQTKEDYKTELRDAKRKIETLSHYTPSQIEAQEFEARKDREATFLQQISDLRRRVQELQEKDEDHSQKLLEASRLRERALQEKEEECALLVRTLKKNHETVLSELEDTHRTELRDVKKKLEESLQANEESYLEQLRDAKKKEQDLMERESTLLKQLEDTEERTSSTIMKQKNDELETILKQKNDEFEQRISAITVEKEELHLEIQRIRKDSDGTNLVITGLEEQLSNCNKEIDKQRRNHRSEMNKLMNTLELQQKKEGRLQSHIQSLEKQIKNMVNDYESRLQDAFYSQM